MKVSVIVPVYNVEAYLEKCLTSLVNQTLKDIEIIIVNDGTKDNSAQIIEKFSNKYKNIKSYTKENGGLSSARNYGLKYATGKYVGFVDSDDYVDETMYEKLYNKIIEDDFDVAICDLYRAFEEKLVYTSSHAKKDLLSEKEIKKTMLCIYPTVWNKLYKKELFDDLEFKQNVWFEDVELLYRMFPKFHKVGVVREPLYYYIQRSGSITSKATLKMYDYIDNFNGIIEFHKANNSYQENKKILEFCYVRYIYATFIKRVLGFDYKEYKKAVDTAIRNVEKNFPKYRKNSLFYSSLKGWYLLIFNKTFARIIYKIKHISI